MINPYRLNYFTRKKIRNKRARILFEKNKLSVRGMNYKNKYVYYPLHFEPERTTNPDGGNYHDQFKTIIKLKSMIFLFCFCLF